MKYIPKTKYTIFLILTFLLLISIQSIAFAQSPTPNTVTDYEKILLPSKLKNSKEKSEFLQKRIQDKLKNLKNSKEEKIKEKLTENKIAKIRFFYGNLKKGIWLQLTDWKN